MSIEYLRKENRELKETISDMRVEHQQMKQLISDMKDVLRFCAMNGVGTYYQQQSAEKMLLESTKIVWSNHKPDGTYTEEYKQWVKENFEKEQADTFLKQLVEMEAKLLQNK